MPLDDFNSDSFSAASCRDEHAHKSALGFLQDSLFYQLNQAEIGLAQPLGLDKQVTHLAEPAAADSTVGRHIQMFGAALGGWLEPCSDRKFYLSNVSVRCDFRCSSICIEPN